MNKRVLVVLGAVVGLLLSAGAASADPTGWHRDPDTTIDPARIAAIVVQLIAPDSTIGDADTTPVGVGTDPVGSGDLTVASTSSSSSSSSSSGGGTIFVDNTPGGDCPLTSYLTIQDGVDASGQGDTVKVCPGTYNEQVRITGHTHDGLRLESLRPLQAIVKWPTMESAPLALVDINMADRVSVRGFKLSGPFTFPACSPDRHEGVLIEKSFDAQIRSNWITEIRNSVPNLRGCQEGDAVAIGRRTTGVGGTGTDPGTAQIDHNLIDLYQKNGVQAVNAGTRATIDHNTITGPGTPPQIHAAPNGVVAFRQAAVTVDHNAISRNHFTGSLMVATSGGVLIFDNPPGSTEIDHNQIFDNDYGIEADSGSNLDISHNDVMNHVTDGIVLCGDATSGCGPATGNVLRSNKVENNRGSGIVLVDADSNLLKSNHVEDNGAGGDLTDGLRVDVNSQNNQILTNHMDDNLTHDCHDDSTGGGTAGTANTWQGDHGDTENRPGLCD